MTNELRSGAILAAGFGKRLRPYTTTTPKPLVAVGGCAMIDYALAHYRNAGVSRVAVNTHYLAGKIEAHLDSYAAKHGDVNFTLSYEPAILDTGGGLKQMLPFLEDSFFVQSGDSLLLEGPSGCPLSRLQQEWNPADMDILLLLQPRAKMTLTDSTGDYSLGDGGLPVRSQNREGPYMWTSVRICHKRIFDDTPEGPFSFLTLMDRAQEKGRLHAIIHDGEWHHISTPEDLDQVNTALAERKRRA